MLSFLSWLRSLRFSCTNRTARRRLFAHRPMRPRFIRLGVEGLEDRTVPSTVTWVGGTSGDWDTPTNWSSGKLPGVADNVVINTANAIVTHTGNNNESIGSLTTGSTDTLNWSAGNLTLSSASTLSGALNLSGGTWQGGGNVTLDGLLSWTGGTMSGSGTTTANAGIDLYGNGGELDGRTLNNANGSTTLWSGASSSLYLGDGAVFNNQAGATFDIEIVGGYSPEQQITGDGTGTFKNFGALNSDTTGDANIIVAFVNSGTVNVNSGQFIIWDGGSSATGTFAVASGGYLYFAEGTYQLGSSSTVSGAGQVIFGGSGSGTTNVNGTYNVSGYTLVYDSATANFNGTLTDLGNSLSIESGGFAKIAKNVTIPTLYLDNGTLTGTGAVTVTGNLYWKDNGVMSGTGSTTLTSTGTLNLGGDTTSQTLDTRTFNNQGTVNWLSGSTGFVYMADGAVFNNQAGATFNAQCDQYVEYGGGITGAFNNAGTFIKSSTASGATVFDHILFNNSGTVNVTSGTLYLGGGGNESSTGSFLVPAGSALLFGAGNTSVASSIGTASSPQAGEVIFSSGGTTNVTGNYNVSGSTYVTNGTVNFNPSSTSTLTSLGGTVTLSGGTTKITKAVTIPTLNLTGGTLTGAGAVNVTGTLTWNNNGVMEGTGSTTLASGGTLNLGGDGTSQTLDQRTFNNAGAANWLAGSGGSFYVQNGGVFNNQTAATLTINCDQTVSTGGTGGTFNNAGTLTKAAGTGTTEFQGVAFNNTGTVNVNSGTLDLAGGGNDSKGVFNVPSAGTLQFGGGNTSLASGIGINSTTKKAVGPILFSGGNTVVMGAYYVGGATTIEGNAIVDFDNKTDSLPTLNLYNGTLTGSAAVTVTGTLTWNDYGTMSGVGSTTLASTGTLNLGGDTTYQVLDQRTFNASGKTNWLAGSGGSFDMNDGAIFNNKSIFTVNCDQNVQGSGVTGSFANSGTFTKAAGTGTTEFYGVAFNNSGTVNVNKGTLDLASGGNDTKGTFYVPLGSTLQFSYGATYLASSIGSSTSKAAGTLFFFGGSDTITGAYNVSSSAVTTIDLGAVVNFDNKTDSMSTLNLYNGTLTGSAAVTVTGTLTWNNGGTMSGVGTTMLSSTGKLNLGGDGTHEVLDTRTFNNAGSVNWLAGSGSLYIENGAIFNNQSAGTFTVNCDQTVSPSGIAGVFNNAGTFTKAAGTGITQFSGILFNNSGTVNVASGTLDLAGGGNDSSTGKFLVPAAGTLRFDGDTTMNSSIGTASTPQAGVVIFNSDGDINGSYNVSGETIVTGTAIFTGLGTLTSLGGTVVISGGGADITPDVTIPTLNLQNGGALTGTGDVTVTGTLNWNSYGHMTGTGTTTLASGGTLNLGGDNSYQVLDTRTFNNQGTANWLSGSGGYFYIEDSAVFNNEAGATFTVNCDQDIYYSGASGVFNNTGTFTKAAGTDTIAYGLAFNNSGTVNVNSGTLELACSGNDSGGSFNVPSTGTLVFGDGNTIVASSIGTASTPQAGTVIFVTGNTEITGSYNVSGSTVVDDGPVTFTPSSTLTSLGGTVTIYHGTLDIEPAVTIPNLNLEGGTLTGSGAVTVTGTLNWNNSSSMSGAGSTTLTSSGTLNLGGDNTAETLNARTFTNQGTANWLNNSTTFNLINGAVFNNTGTFNANTPYGSSPTTEYIDSGDSTGTFANAGTFNSAAGSGNTVEVEATAFDNSGTVNVNSGTLQLYFASGTSSGSFAVSSGSALSFRNGDYNLSSGSITGAGTVNLDGNEVDLGYFSTTGAVNVLGGTVNFPLGGGTGAFTHSGGTVNLTAGTVLDFTGNYTQSGGYTDLNGGILAEEGGGGSVIIQSGTSLYGPGYINGNISNDGYIFVGGGGIDVGTLQISGNFTQTYDGALYFNIGGPTAGTQYDQMVIGGSASLGGALNLGEVYGYTPASGTPFTLMTYASESGDFSPKNLGGLSSASPGSTSYVATA